MKELQNGRSMIEMLGVLAIIGVLSIGGLAGYTMAMNRHRANQILDYVSRCAVAAQTKGDGYVIGEGALDANGVPANNAKCGTLLPLEEAPNGLEGSSFIVSKAGAATLTFTIATPKIKSQDIRTALLNRDNTNVTIKECTTDACSAFTAVAASDANGKIVAFTFKK